jgi:hypothetical protein
MSEEQVENNNLEDNLPMVNYIMLHRVYDMLTLIANKLGDPAEVQKMVNYHEQGYLLGPSPSFISPDNSEKSVDL